MARNFFILSLGQLTKSDWKKSIHAFTALSVDQSKLPHFIAYPLYFLRTLAVYGWDMLFGKNIENYKLGKKTTDEFMEFLRSKFRGNTDNQLKGAWNSMCVIDDRSLEDIKTAIALKNDYLEVDSKNYDVEPVVVSATNPLHFEFIKEKVKANVEDKAKVDSFFTSITKSYDEGVKTLNQTKLANTALAKLKPTAGTDKIISLHWGIVPQNCSWKFRFNPNHAGLREVIESLARSSSASGMALLART